MTTDKINGTAGDDQYKPIWKICGPSQGGNVVMVRLLWSFRAMNALYPSDFTGTARAASCNLAIALQGQANIRKSLQYLTYETEFVLFLAALENSVLPIG